MTYTYFQGCSIGGNLYWHTTEVDIEFDDVLSAGTWNFGPGNPTASQYDFESVVLHEMAHALLLGHVIDESKVMHRFITNGATRRLASADEIAAANAVRARSTVNANMCGFFPLTLPGHMTVSNVNDTGVGSLRQAATDVCDSDTIVFSLPASSTIALTSAEITIDKDMQIHGLDMNNFILSGNNARRIFSVNAGKTLTLQNMKLANATSTTNGGAIYNNGIVNLKNILFQNNTQGSTKKALTSGTGTSVIVEGMVTVKQ
ncbi:MAG: matrixin family metalloprotease [Saprospiraceae bacterium]|nr:matrixin family metalloprotease [Saprospiraceae bacterium]